MNARPWRAAALFLAATAPLCPNNAYSIEFPYNIADPLRTVPDVMEKGVTLPGDSTPIPRAARKDFTQPLTLAEAVDLALSNNREVKWAWAEIKVQAGALGEAYAAYLPVISGSASWTNDTIDYSDSQKSSTYTNSTTVQASASWRIFDFGGRSAGRKSSENLLAAALAGYNATLQDVLAKVIRAYFDATTAGASVTAKTKDEEVAQGTLHSAIKREAMGAVSQSDTLRAMTALARAALDKSRALGEYQKSVAVLRHYLGLPGAAELLLPSELHEHQGGVIAVKELSIWLEEARLHPTLIAARKQLDAAQEQVVVARSSGLPVVSLAAHYYQNTRPGEAVNQGAQETMLTATLSIPFFEGFATTYKLRGAQAQVEKKAAALADTEQQVAMGVIKAHADADAALRNLEASATLLESARSSLAVSQRKYNKGAADITEVLSTQAALADAWNERVRCLAEWHSSRLQLLASTGKLGRYALENK